MASLTPEQAAALAEKKLLGTLTEAENAALLAWANQQLPASIEWNDDQNEQALKERLYAQIRERVDMERSIPHVYRVLYFGRYRWAAAAVLVLACSAIWFLVSQKQPAPQVTAVTTDVLAPVKNKATLTINGEQRVVLDNIANGAEATTGVTKNDGNFIVYSDHIEKIETHNWSNPVGSPALLIELPDQTKAWLNASSSISFTTRFTGKLREVVITGEVYFEVKHDASQPFRVQAGAQTIEDIGTAFNVNAYPDEPGTRTTLIEGSVRVSEKDKVKTLKPGQAFFNGAVAEADTDQAVAWKNGLFSFGNAVDLATALRQLGRWYGVEIVYEGKIPRRQFGGEIHRNLSLAGVLAILKEQKVEARIEGRKLIITE